MTFDDTSSDPFDALIPTSDASQSMPPSAQNQPVQPAATQASDQDPDPFESLLPQQNLGAWGVLKEAGRRGLVEGLTSAQQGLTPFQDRPQEQQSQDQVSQLLAQPISQGWSDPKWWVSHIAHGAASSSPALATSAAGSALGSEAGPIGTLAGGAGGFALGTAVQTVAPAYQKARAEGLSHEDAVDRAIKETGVASSFAAVMGLAPGASIFGTTVEGAVKRPLSEALAQIFGVQPGLGIGQAAATQTVEGKGALTPEAAAQAYAEQVGVGAAMVGGHALISGGAHAAGYGRPVETSAETPTAATPEDQALKDAGVTIDAPQESYENVPDSLKNFYEATKQDTRPSFFTPAEKDPFEALIPQNEEVKTSSQAETAYTSPDEDPFDALLPVDDRPLYALPENQTTAHDVDPLGYYSQALEAAQDLKQNKGTPQQMIAQLKKAGVKDAEIDATGLNQFLDGKKIVSKDDIVQHLQDNRIAVNETQYVSPVESEWGNTLPAPPGSIADKIADQFDHDGSNYEDQEGNNISDIADKYASENSEGVYEFHDGSRLIMSDDGWDVAGPSRVGKWADYSLDPKNPTYRETVLHLPSDNGETQFQSGHFAQPNIIGHMMTSMVKDSEGNRVFNVDQIQSDWGQRLRDKGVRDEERVKHLSELLETVDANFKSMLFEAGKWVHNFYERKGEPDSRSSIDNNRTIREFVITALDDISRIKKNPEAKELLDKSINLKAETDRLTAELRTAKAAASGNPLVNTTDQWVNTTLRRAITQAVESGADKIAIPSGDTVLSYNPGDTEGMRGFYDKIVPKNLKNILRKLDPKSPDPERVGKLVTSTEGEKGHGFTLFPITDAVRAKVKSEGQPLFRINNENEPAANNHEQIKQDILDKIKPLLPKNVSLSVVDKILTPSGDEALGRSSKKLIEVSLASGDRAVSIGQHEVIHALRQGGFFTPKEWALLNERAEMLGVDVNPKYENIYRDQLKNSGYSGKDLEQRLSEFMSQERVAKMAEAWQAGARTPGDIQGLFQRILDFVRSLGNVLRGHGFTTADEVMQKAMTGEEIAAREGAEPNNSLSQYGIEPPKPKDLIQFLRSRGGIKPSRETAAIDATRIPGLINGRGMTHDQARESLVEAGYIREDSNAVASTSVADFHNLLADAVRGERIVPEGAQQAEQEYLDREEQKINRASLEQKALDQLDNLGIRDQYDVLSKPEKIELQNRIDAGESADDVLEQIAVRDYNDMPEISDKKVRDQARKNYIPGFEDETEATTTSQGRQRSSGISENSNRSKGKGSSSGQGENVRGSGEGGGKPPSTPAAGGFEQTPDGPIGRYLHGLIEKFGIGDAFRDIQMKTAPMAARDSTIQSKAAAKDFASYMRQSQWESAHWDKLLQKEFNLEEQKAMWEAADEESVLRQQGKEPGSNEGLNKLSPKQRDSVKLLQKRAEDVYDAAKAVGIVDDNAEGLPSYVPRMVVMAGETGFKQPSSQKGRRPLDALGRNLIDTTPNVKNRKYLTTPETEAAAKAKFGEKAQVVKNIRTLNIATSRLKESIAGRALINKIKEMGKQSGEATVYEGAVPSDAQFKYFTLDHPSFKEWKPRLEKGEDGRWNAVLDKEGNPIFEQIPIYVRSDFEGPLRAVLSQSAGDVYKAFMALKMNSVGLIMYSPMIHNAVEFSRALPIMPLKMMTLKVYRDGYQAKNDYNTMREFLKAGGVPIGDWRGHGGDASAIMNEPSRSADKGWLTRGLRKYAGDVPADVTGKALNFWHQTMLWDRIADLQMGLYTNLRDQLIKDGKLPDIAAKTAAHWANRYAGAVPSEAMANGARKLTNLTEFSRSFTIGNIGVMKDIFMGLPSDVQAQIARDHGLDKLADIKSKAKRKAMSAFMLDTGLYYISNSLLQNAMNTFLLNEGDPIVEGYGRRFKEYMSHWDNFSQNPFDVLRNPFSALSATHENEPGKEDRIKVGYQDNGTAIYIRNPFGKIGEEFLGYMSEPLNMFNRKQSTLLRPLMQTIANDKGFGRKVYDPNAELPLDLAKNAAKIAYHFVESQVPVTALQGLYDLATGAGNADTQRTASLQVLGPLAGLQTSQGFPGGPAKGELFREKQNFEYKFNEAKLGIVQLIKGGDLAKAGEQMDALGVPAKDQKSFIRATENPSKMSNTAKRNFEQRATPEQAEHFNRQLSQQEFASGGAVKKKVEIKETRKDVLSDLKRAKRFNVKPLERALSRELRGLSV